MASHFAFASSSTAALQSRYALRIVFGLYPSRAGFSVSKSTTGRQRQFAWRAFAALALVWYMNPFDAIITHQPHAPACGTSAHFGCAGSRAALSTSVESARSIARWTARPDSGGRARERSPPAVSNIDRASHSSRAASCASACDGS